MKLTRFKEYVINGQRLQSVVEVAPQRTTCVLILISTTRYHFEHTSAAYRHS